MKEQIMRFAAKAGLKLKEARPDILFYGGCALLLGGTVYACRKTLEIEPIIDEANEEHEDIDKYVLDEKSRKKEHVKVNLKMAGRIAKTYAIPAGMMTLGYLGVGKAHIDLKRDKKELLATVATLDNMYRRYRDRTKEELGEEKANDIYRGLGATEKMEKEDEASEPVKKVFRTQAYDPNDITSFVFSKETCPYVWKDDPILNRNTLVNLIMFAQNQYNTDGYLHMKPIYDMFGYYLEPGEYHCRVGAEYGYVKGHGADTIDIGLYDKSNIEMQEFLNGERDAVWIHFNDCGPINKYL